MISIRQTVVVALVIAGLWLLQRLSKRLKTQRQDKTRFLEMVRCTECGSHLPRSQAISHDDGFVCGQTDCPSHRHST